MIDELHDLIIERGLLRHHLFMDRRVTQIRSLVQLGRNRQITIHDYLHGGCLGIGDYSIVVGASEKNSQQRVTRAIMAARNLRGLDGEPIEMPHGISAYRGLLLEKDVDGYVRVRALTPTQKVVTTWRTIRGRARAEAARQCYGEGFCSVDGIPGDVHMIMNRNARRAALDSYEAVRSS